VVRRKACAFPGADPTTWFTIVSLSHAWLAACGGRIKRAHEAGRIRNSLSRVKAGFKPFFAAFFSGRVSDAPILTEKTRSTTKG